MFALKNGYSSFTELAADFARCAEAGGFKLISVDGSTANPTLPAQGSAGDTLKFVLESTAAVDPCFDEEAKQVYRLRVEATHGNKGGIRIWQATPLQIKDDGTGVTWPTGSQGSTKSLEMCELTLDGTTNESTGSNDLSFVSYASLVNKGGRNDTLDVDPDALPLSQYVAVSKHGITLFVWAEALDNTGHSFSWFCTQRGIEPADGAVWTDKKAPLWCVYSTNGGGVKDINEEEQSTGIFQFVVREADVEAPVKPSNATLDGPDTNRLFNVNQMVSITEDEKFNLSIPRDLTTQRYFYPVELDMIGYCSADVISQYAEAPVRMYGESEDRVFKAMNANFQNNAGMRIMLLAKSTNLIDISNAI